MYMFIYVCVYIYMNLYFQHIVSTSCVYIYIHVDVRLDSMSDYLTEGHRPNLNSGEAK